jgi:murein DD-endopeptidase MepM/ murein hydrolase activator NlpD
VRRTGPNNTDAWLAALQPLVTEFGMTQTDAAIAGGVHFPIAGPTTWVDDWHYPRFVPTFHLHQGVDLFAAGGTPIRAPFDGMLKFTDGAVGGMAAYVTQSDGTFVYMAHMSAYAPGKATGQPVHQGEVVGFVGNTGDAQGGATHCHFELHPLGGQAAPPKPTVDGWLAEATAAAPALIAATRQARNPAAPAAVGASVTAVPEGSTLPVEVSAAVDPAAALWAAASNPAIGTVDLASSLVASAADGIDWPKPPG